MAGQAALTADRGTEKKAGLMWKWAETQQKVSAFCMKHTASKCRAHNLYSTEFFKLKYQCTKLFPVRTEVYLNACDEVIGQLTLV